MAENYTFNMLCRQVAKNYTLKLFKVNKLYLVLCFEIIKKLQQEANVVVKLKPNKPGNNAINF